MSQLPRNSLNRKSASMNKDDITSDIMRILAPTFQVGALSGLCGLFVGAIAGIIRSASPVLFSLASGFQFTVLGSTFTAFRQILISSWSSNEISSREKLWISAIAGALGGGISGAILRGRNNVVPGVIMFALFGATGQAMHNEMDYSTIRSNPNNPGSMSWINSKWSPVRAISDQEYEDILQNKILQVRADISLIDEKIETIKSNQLLTESDKENEPAENQRKPN